MFVNNIEINNFRGIKSANISFSTESRIACMIGAGDSTKSTILKAIEWVMWPSWNLLACDNDFFMCNVTEPIVLRGTVSELPSKLLSEDKYGLYLRKPGVPLEDAVDDEPEENQPVCLTVQLTINETLEPRWEVVCNRKEPKIISHTDRKLLAVGNIGGNCAKDMVWGKFSVLQKYSDAKGVLHDAHTAALREVAKHADLSVLDDVNETLIAIGQQYGVGFQNEINNRVIVQNGSLSATVGLYDGESPLNQRGTGSQRLLSMGLNIQASDGNALLLIDEIESGLEPYRIRSLLNEFRVTHKTAGQIILTTHSPIVVAECTIDEILIIQSSGNSTKAFRLKSDDEDINRAMQAEVRKNAEAFLSKRLIVCEGKTEIGFVRALDTYLAKTKNYRMAHKGVGTADGGGSTIFKCAEILRSCGYDICLLMDSDLPEEELDKLDFLLDGVFDWDEPNSFEEQIFFDISTEIATQIINIVVRERGLDSVKNRLDEGNIPYEISDEEIHLLQMDAEVQKAIGSIAKRKKVEWYKRIDLGEMVGNVLFENWEMISESAKLRKNVDELIEWVIKDDRVRTEENISNR